MSSGEEGALNEHNEQIRYPRSRSWLQFYVDLFTTACPKHCKDLSAVVVSDPTRCNGCNWQLAISAPEDKPEHESLCLQYIEDDLRLLFSIFDLEEDAP